jgi:hypothetical protein
MRQTQVHKSVGTISAAERRPFRWSEAARGPSGPFTRDAAPSRVTPAQSWAATDKNGLRCTPLRPGRPWSLGLAASSAPSPIVGLSFYAHCIQSASLVPAPRRQFGPRKCKNFNLIGARLLSLFAFRCEGKETSVKNLTQSQQRRVMNASPLPPSSRGAGEPRHGNRGGRGWTIPGLVPLLHPPSSALN